jgi:hypothetical protein
VIFSDASPPAYWRTYVISRLSVHAGSIDVRDDPETLIEHVHDRAAGQPVVEIAEHHVQRIARTELRYSFLGDEVIEIRQVRK